VLVEIQLVRVDEPRLPWTVGHGQVLQRALAALVTHRAVEWMAGQDELKNVVPPGNHLLGCRTDDHAVIGGLRAGRLQLGKPPHNRRAIFVQLWLAGLAVHGNAAQLHQAHAAHADRLHFGMVTEDRDIRPEHLGRVDQIGASGNLVILTIDSNRYECHSAPQVSGHESEINPEHSRTDAALHQPGQHKPGRRIPRHCLLPLPRPTRAPPRNRLLPR